ncbi:MAG: tRNA pseudouridine(38-40) synthase TruA [Acidobacteria bacterium]|nr:tRNA pseudouridine(38-40) synthase TruA [Acidobacteriota bacterium]
MKTYKLTIEYDGTRYHGWQEQKTARTIYGEIRQAAKEYFRAPIILGGAGRTDSGVHALAQVAHLRVESSASSREVQYALNDQLPPDINIIKVEEQHLSFNARHEAITRYYLYQIAQRRTAFAKKYVWWIKDSLEVAPMQNAAEFLVGRHDFQNFCEPREDDGSTKVVVESVDLKVDGDLILFRIGASHFLWKMVRRIVGTLVGVGRGQLSASAFNQLMKPLPTNGKAIFDIAANTAPPSGLFLEKIIYDKTERVDDLAPAFSVKRF